MKKILYLIAFVTLCLTLCSYRNPVLPGFHADPSVCRVGEDYYLVNSTFQYFPGVPVYHSKDLVNWEQIGACLTRKSQVDLTGLDGGNGIYAPTIRYNDGRFYMITTHFPSRRHFYVYTDDPAGEWSDPIFIDFEIGSCDPTLYFEEDKCYFLWKNGDIKICEIDVETGKQLGEIHHLGAGLGGRYPEGPHIYRKDGWYYLLLAEGGTEHGHHVNILRSRELFGPYESNPANPILSHFNMKMQGSPIQGLGHADLIDAVDGSWWMICLGYRTHGYLQHVMGRETFLAPVEWKEGDWPVVNGDGTLQLEMDVTTLPEVKVAGEPSYEDFSCESLPIHWSYLCNPDSTKYSFSERPGYLRLKASEVNIDDTASPTFVARRQTEYNFSATAEIDFSNLKNGSQAGLTAYAAAHYHYDVEVRARGRKHYIAANIRIDNSDNTVVEIPVKTRKAFLRITGNRNGYILQYSLDGKNYVDLAEMGYRPLSTETIGGFTGVMLGLYAQGTEGSFADFDSYSYEVEL